MKTSHKKASDVFIECVQFEYLVDICKGVSGDMGNRTEPLVLPHNN